ncbi:alanine--tRNA ligase, partial [candidate division WWE3 bacterium]|nr:alanine--tRNA ligase [candidate division WWE3 bacterium]
RLEHLLAREGMLSGEDAFMIYETYGLPLELIQEIAKEVNVEVDVKEFNNAYDKHKEKSRKGTEAKFKGGLEGTTDKHVKYHTATHLLHKALRDVLGESVYQKGSNITTERLRFDFSYDRKVTPEQLKAVEDIVNLKISQALPVKNLTMSREEAEKAGALHLFNEKYGDNVKVYFIGEALDKAFSKEFCGGPHVENIAELGVFKIIKDEAVSDGVRRIRAILL